MDSVHDIRNFVYDLNLLSDLSKCPKMKITADWIIGILVVISFSCIAFVQ